MNNNSTSIILGVVIGLALGAFGGYAVGQKSMAETEKEIAAMTSMMRSDGEQMVKMGGMMMSAGKMMEEGGAKYNDEVMLMMGKDLGASGMKHRSDGQSMMGGDMMDMGGMDHSGM